MVTSEVLRVALRWVHLLAAVAWLGGALFYLVVLSPAGRDIPEAWRAPLLAAVRARYRELVETAIIALAVTGAVLSFDRLSGPGSSTRYAAVLAVKIALGLWMFYLAYRLGARGRRPGRGDAGMRGRRDAETRGRGDVGPAQLGGAAAPGRVGADRGAATPSEPLAPGLAPRLVLGLGIVVLLLAVALRSLYGAP